MTINLFGIGQIRNIFFRILFCCVVQKKMAGNSRWRKTAVIGDKNTPNYNKMQGVFCIFLYVRISRELAARI